MTRVLLASCAVVLSSVPLGAAEAKPLWELPVTPTPEKAATPAWFSYSPDGAAIVVVTVRSTAGAFPEYTFHLRVLDAATRKERFNAALGAGRSFHWGDELAGFPSDTTVLTGGQSLVTRDLATGNQQSSAPAGGPADHVVWTVPDLKESFVLRRDPQRFDAPAELFHHAQVANQFDEFGGRGGFRGVRPGMNAFRDTTLAPPRPGLRTEVVAMNGGRTRLAASFRDEVPTGRARHGLALYRVKTVEEFDLEVVGEVSNPHPGPVSAMAFARNGRVLATGGEDGSVAIWDVTHGLPTKPRALLTDLATHRVTALAFSHDWRHLAAVTWDRSRPNLIVIDADSGRAAGSIRLERQLTGVAWHPDGHTLLSAGASGTIQAWDVGALVKGN